MTIGDRQPPEFKRGQVLRAADLNSLAQSVAAILNRFQGNQVQGEILTGKLDGNLNAATSFANSPATATLSVWVKDENGNYVEATRNVTVTNRFENLNFVAGQILRVQWIDGEWQPVAADCE
jgi:hypothetical protein